MTSHKRLMEGPLSPPPPYLPTSTPQALQLPPWRLPLAPVVLCNSCNDSGLFSGCWVLSLNNLELLELRPSLFSRRGHAVWCLAIITFRKDGGTRERSPHEAGTRLCPWAIPISSGKIALDWELPRVYSPTMEIFQKGISRSPSSISELDKVDPSYFAHFFIPSLILVPIELSSRLHPSSDHTRLDATHAAATAPRSAALCSKYPPFIRHQQPVSKLPIIVLTRGTTRGTTRESRRAYWSTSRENHPAYHDVGRISIDDFFWGSASFLPPFIPSSPTQPLAFRATT
ncbi:hypothetical protein C8R45DRAFT_1137393 [Mycena sanguinolenta]|nr:hypothetical protein C8R45DRAFT_1137393 [Mycena sanguinolenta]